MVIKGSLQCHQTDNRTYRKKKTKTREHETSNVEYAREKLDQVIEEISGTTRTATTVGFN